MALYYNLHTRSDVDHEWHVGESTKQMNEYGYQCVCLQADGDELAAIQEQFQNIPMTNRPRVVRWKGDDAAFIAMNLR